MKDITIEEATQIMRNHICWIENKTVKQAIEKVLKELNSKKGTINALQEALKERTDERDKKDETINKKDKIIDAMAEYINKLNYIDDIECEFEARHNLKYSTADGIMNCQDCIKQYFERKVADERRNNQKTNRKCTKRIRINRLYKQNKANTKCQ